MRRGDIIQFLRLLRAGNIDTSGSDWVQASCPLAVRTHQKGEDRRPSFGIKVNDKGELMTGVCRSVPELMPEGRIRLHETWRWTSGDGSSGRSVLEEIDRS